MKKSIARKKCLKKRDGLGEAKRQEYDGKILEKVLLFLYDKQSVFVYNNFKSEVSTKHIIAFLKASDIDVYLPKIIHGKMLAVKDDGEYEVNSYGILEPKGNQVADKIDVAITPLSAVDKRFNRVGYGKGFYDKFFEQNDCLKVGVCYSCQVVGKIKADRHDVPLDMVITEKYIRIRNKK